MFYNKPYYLNVSYSYFLGIIQNLKYRAISFSLVLGGLLSSCGDDESVDCALSLASDAINAAQCAQANGTVTLATSGENGSVSYRLDDGAPQGSATFEALAPGTYTITAQDDAGCTATASVTIPDEEVTLMVAAAVSPSDCNQSEGIITLDVSGGTAPYTYSLDSTNFVDNSAFSDLSPGEYDITIRDAAGCATTLNARIPSGISFDATIKEIISTNCTVTGCHAAVAGRPNFEIEEQIFANAARIENRTSEGTMPPPGSGRSLTDEQIAQITCWVGDGAPDN